MADYSTRENNDEREMLKLVFQSLRALSKEALPRRLVRYVFEQKAMVVNGEFPGMPQDGRLYSEAVAYTVEYVTASSIEKLYTFALKDEVLEEYSAILDGYRKRYIDKHFKSLEVLRELGM